MVQWRAARWVLKRYHNTSSVTDMLQHQSCPWLANITTTASKCPFVWHVICVIILKTVSPFYGRKTGFTTKLALSNGKTGFTNKTLIIKLNIQFLSVKPVLPFDNDSFIRKTGFTVENTVFMVENTVFMVENTVL